MLLFDLIWKRKSGSVGFILVFTILISAQSFSGKNYLKNIFQSQGIPNLFHIRYCSPIHKIGAIVSVLSSHWLVFPFVHLRPNSEKLDNFVCLKKHFYAVVIMLILPKATRIQRRGQKVEKPYSNDPWTHLGHPKQTLG